MTTEAKRLKALFARRDFLAAQLATVDRRISVSADEYRKSQGLLMRPRLEAIRKELGA